MHRRLQQDIILHEVNGMKVEVNEDYSLSLKEVFTGVRFETKEGETLAVCMRDGGFEITVGKDMRFRIKDGVLERMGGERHEQI